MRSWYFCSRPERSRAFQATFQADRQLTASDVALIADGTIKLFAFGYVEYRGTADTEYLKGFITLYSPTSDPQYGAFGHYEQANYNYDK
jgi:hypothetical protein